VRRGLAFRILYRVLSIPFCVIRHALRTLLVSDLRTATARDLPRKNFAVLVNLIWQITTALAKVVDHGDKTFLEFAVVTLQRRGNIAVIFLLERFRIPKLAAAGNAMLCPGIHVETKFFIPQALFVGSKTKVVPATRTVKNGVNVPVPRTDTVILSADVRLDRGRVVHTQTAPKKWRGILRGSCSPKKSEMFSLRITSRQDVAPAHRR
jgi:hypothetical protein